MAWLLVLYCRIKRRTCNGSTNWFCGFGNTVRGVFNLVLDAKGKKVVESESHDLRTGEGGLLKRDGVSGR